MADPELETPDQQDAPTSERTADGPFDAAPVDRLVYRQSTDAPELRAAAAYVPITAPRREMPVAVPSAPEKRDFKSWTPAADEEADVPISNPEPFSDPELRSVSNTARIVFTVLAVAIPLLLLGGAIALGISIAGGL